MSQYNRNHPEETNTHAWFSGGRVISLSHLTQINTQDKITPNKTVPTLNKVVIKTTKPKIPDGFRKIRHDRGGYKKSVLGREIESENPVWAEKRYDKNAIFSEDREYYVLFTYIPE